MEPKVVHYIKFRITKWKSLDKLREMLMKYDKTMVVSENEKSNHHYQGIVVKKSKNPVMTKSVVDNFRKKIKKEQDLEGNKDFSIGEITETPEKYIRYLCKGGGEKDEPKVFINNILLENEVTLNHVKFWEENKNLKTTDANRKYNKIKAFELSKKVSEFVENKEEIKWAMKIIMYHDANNLLIPDGYSIKKMVKTYMMKDSDNKEKVALSMAYEVFPGYRPD
jgi:hypothetical protein